WPRALSNPGRTGGVGRFTPTGMATAFFDQTLPGPPWKSSALSAGAGSAFRGGWEELNISAPATTQKLTRREYRTGEARDLAGDFAFCVGRAFSLVRIEDPYLLADDCSIALCAAFWKGWRSCGSNGQPNSRSRLVTPAQRSRKG